MMRCRLSSMPRLKELRCERARILLLATCGDVSMPTMTRALLGWWCWGLPAQRRLHAQVEVPGGVGAGERSKARTKGRGLHGGSRAVQRGKPPRCGKPGRAQRRALHEMKMEGDADANARRCRRLELPPGQDRRG